MLDTFSYFLSLKKKKKGKRKMGRGRNMGGGIKKGLCRDDQNPSAVG